MKKFLKENLVLVVGVSMPVVVVLLFLLASGLPKGFTEPPGYDFLFTTNSYRNRLSVTVDFDVSNKQLRARAYKTKENHSGYVPKLFLYEHERQTVRELTVELPADLEDLKDGTEIPVADVARWLLDTSRKAPDGYEFRDSYRHRGGLMGEIFYSGRRRHAVVKGAAVYRIPDTDGQYYGNINFLGWVVGEGP